MTRILSVKIWKQLHDFLLTINKEITAEKYYSQILKQLKKIIPFNAAHIIIYGDEQKFSRLITSNIKQQTINNYLSYYQKIDIFKEISFNQPQATKTTRIIDYKNLKKTEYFNDFLKKNSFYYLAGIDIHYNQKLLITITLIRNQKQSDFNKLELLTLNILQPHIANHLYLLT